MSDRDKFLTEAMGECWHGISDYSEKEQNYSTWQGFGKIWEWAKVQEWWGDFIYYKQSMFTVSKGEILGGTASNPVYEHVINVDSKFLAKIIDLINPDTFADALYEFLKERS